MIVLRDIKLFSKVLIRSRFWINGVKKGNRILRYFRPYNVINHLCHNSLSKVLSKAPKRSSIQISTITCTLEVWNRVHRRSLSILTWFGTCRRCLVELYRCSWPMLTWATVESERTGCWWHSRRKNTIGSSMIVH